MGFLANIKQRIGRRLAEWSGPGGIIDPDEFQFRPVGPETGENSDRMDEIRRERSRRIAPALYFRDAIGGAIVDGQVDRVIGAGAEFKAKDEEVQKVVDRFIADPDNNLNEDLELYAKELTVYGELVLPIFLTAENADVRLGYLHPWQVKAPIFQRGNAKRALAVIQRPYEASGKTLLWIVPHPSPEFDDRFPAHPALATGETPNTEAGLDGLPVALPSDAQGAVLPEIAEVLKDSNVQVAGYCFYHRNASLLTGRGRSVYERVQDWCKALQDWFFGVLRNAVLQGLILAHVQVTGADEKELDKWREKFKRLPKPGSIFFTNEKTTWNLLTAELPPAAPVKELLQGVLKIVGVAVGLPPHEIGAEGDSNRATAHEAKAISTNRAKRFQLKLAAMVITWLNYQVDQKVWRGQLSQSVDRKVECVLPEIDAKDQAAEAQSLNFAVTGMVTAVESTLILETDARRYLYNLLGQDMPSDDDFAAAAADQAQKRAEQFMAGAGQRLAGLLKQGSQQDQDTATDPAIDKPNGGNSAPQMAGGGA